MYLVVSKWRLFPGMEEAFQTGRGRAMREWLRSQPEVEMTHEFLSGDGHAIAVLGYKDEESYRRLILEPGGPFDRKMEELKLDPVGEWVWSERGTTTD